MPFTVLKGADGVQFHPPRPETPWGELRLSPFPNKYTYSRHLPAPLCEAFACGTPSAPHSQFRASGARASCPGKEFHRRFLEGFVRRGPPRRAKSDKNGDPLRGHSRPRLANREGVLVAHPRPAAPKFHLAHLTSFSPNSCRLHPLQRTF